MLKFRAKLIGESDGHTVVREFDELHSAIGWLQREGLAEYEDQTARGEVQAEDGKVAWARSHLQTPERRDRNELLEANRMLAQAGWRDFDER
jgi:hypothetical protein